VNGVASGLAAVAGPDWWAPLPAAVSDAVLAGVVLVAAVRAAVALAEARARAGDWPLGRCGAAVPVLVAHDVAVGFAAYTVLAVLPVRLLPTVAALVPVPVATIGTLLALLVSGSVVRRRRGLPFAAMGRPGALSQEPMLTVRGRLLVRIERRAARASARWIATRLERCRRRAGVPDEQLLPAVWAPGRIRLRESVGVGRTEVALLLLQAQAVVDDASPPHERLLTLLHLIHDRAGRRGVRSVLDATIRGPLRHGRTGAPSWGVGPGAVPGPMDTAPPNPFPASAAH